MTSLDLSPWDEQTQEAVQSFLDFWELAEKIAKAVQMDPAWIYDRIQDQLRTPVFAVEQGDLPPLPEPRPLPEEAPGAGL